MLTSVVSSISGLLIHSSDLTVSSSFCCVVSQPLWNHSQQLKNKFWYSSILKTILIFDSSFPFNYCLILHFLEELPTHFNLLLNPLQFVFCFVIQLELFLPKSSKTSMLLNSVGVSFSYLDACRYSPPHPPACSVWLVFFSSLISSLPILYIGVSVT